MLDLPKIEVNVVSSLSAPKINLSFLDGLRGLAALYVMLYHSWAGNVRHLPRLAQQVTCWLQFGHWPVDVFIVLSGYCLMLPVARSQGLLVQGGFGGYLKRRAKRILPPYYAALSLALLLIGIFPRAFVNGIQSIYSPLPAFGVGNIVTHLLLLHNLNPNWTFRINPVFWSISTEWEIYFFFPLLLLPMWRRFGPLATLAGTFFLGTSCHYLSPKMDVACAWYLGLFTLGMIGAWVNFNRSLPSLFVWLRENAGFLALAIAAVLAVGYHVHAIRGKEYALDALVGTVATCTIVFCTHHCGRARRPMLLRVLESRWPVRLGYFSYSLYLTHIIVFAMTGYCLAHVFHVTHELWLMGMIAGPVLAVPLAYAFHLAFEKRFMNHKPSIKKESGTIVLVASPTPLAEGTVAEARV